MGGLPHSLNTGGTELRFGGGAKERWGKENDRQGVGAGKKRGVSGGEDETNRKRGLPRKGLEREVRSCFINEKERKKSLRSNFKTGQGRRTNNQTIISLGNTRKGKKQGS